MRKLVSIFLFSASLALAAPSTTVVQSGDTLGSIAARNGVSVGALLKANGLSATSTLKIGQVLKLPGGSSSQKTAGITVQSGDTLGSIAKRYGVSVATLRAANGLPSDSVSVGQVLRLSGSAPVQSSTTTSSNTAKSSGGTVTVQSGDTLGEIAQANGTTVAALKAANGLSGNDLKLGQVLKLPGSNKSSTTSKTSSNVAKSSTSSNAAKSSGGTVTVKAGDTLGEIAQANNTTIAALKAANGLSSNDLKLGQVLKLSGSSGAPNTTVKTSATSSSKTPAKNATVTVKAGDSLSKIAVANGTSIAALRAKNGLSSDDLKLGQVLKLPSGDGSKAANSSVNTPTAKSYGLPSSVQVQKGESLSKIAKQYGLSIETLRKLNNLKSDDLALGQTLRLKPAPVVAKTEKPSSSNKPSANTTIAKTNQNKPATKPSTNKPNSSTPKPSTTATKPSSSTTTTKTDKPAATSNSSQKTTTVAKANNQSATNQKPSTTQASSNTTKPTTQASSGTTKPSSGMTKATTAPTTNTPKPAPVAVKPAPLKPSSVSTIKPAPQPTVSAAVKPTIPSVKPSQPIASTQPPKPVMNEATLPETNPQTPIDASNPQTTNSSDPNAATNDTASGGTPNSTSANQDISTLPAPETDQSQSSVGSDADYIIIEPQNSLEIVGQRTGSALSTLPAAPPINTTPQQRAKYTREHLLWPLQGVLTSYYGYRSLRIGRSHFHTGLDIAAPMGTPVYAALSGRVEQAGWSRVGYGKLVIIRGWDGRQYYYGHNSRLLVKVGQWINQGSMISKVGMTGYATGPHLHFEVRIAGHTRNPLAYLPRSQVQFARYAPKR